MGGRDCHSSALAKRDGSQPALAQRPGSIFSMSGNGCEAGATIHRIRMGLRKDNFREPAENTLASMPITQGRHGHDDLSSLDEDIQPPLSPLPGSQYARPR